MFPLVIKLFEEEGVGSHTQAIILALKQKMPIDPPYSSILKGKRQENHENHKILTSFFCGAVILPKNAN